MSGRNYEDIEVSISIKDMLMRICLKWRAMVVWAVLLAVIMNGFGMFKYYNYAKHYNESIHIKNDKSAMEDRIQSAWKKVNETQNALSQREAEEVERVVEVYQSLLVRYENALKYNTESAYMSLDPARIPTVTLQFMINNHYQAEYPVIEARDNTSAILNALSVYATSDEICRQIVDRSKLISDVAYVSELICAEIYADNITIRIMGISEENCRSMADIVRDAELEYAKKLKGEFGEFDITLLLDDYSVISSADVLNLQTTQVNNLNNIKSAFNNLPNTMVDKQREYYYALLDSRSLEDQKKVIDSDKAANVNLDEETETEEKTPLPLLNPIHKKYVLLGFVLGIFMVCAWVGVGYILTPGLRRPKDMEEKFGTDLVGVIHICRFGKFAALNLFIRHLFGVRVKTDYGEAIEIVSGNVEILSSRNDVQKLFVTSSCECEEVKKIMEDIREYFGEKETAVTTGNYLLSDLKSVQMMVESDAVLIVEKTGSSRYEEINAEIEKCRMNKMPVLGCIVID